MLWWESILEGLLKHVDLPSLLAKIGGTPVLNWAVKVLDFVGVNFLAEVRAKQAYNPDLKAFIQQQLVNEHQKSPEENTLTAVYKVATAPETWAFIKALGLAELNTIEEASLHVLVAVYHQEIAPVLPEIAGMWMARGVMPSASTIANMIADKAQTPPPTAAATPLVTQSDAPAA